MKKSIKVFFIIASIMLLSGCSASGEQSGFFFDVFVHPMTWSIHELGSLFGGSYGMAIVAITILIRLLLMPLMMKSYKNQRATKSRMKQVQPQLDALKVKAETAKTPEEQKKIQMEMMEIYKKNKLFNIGCLPTLVQMPILMGLYFAIRTSQDTANEMFLWFNLGSPDLIITILAGIVYFIQARASTSDMTGPQKQQMQIMAYLSPLMIILFSFSAPAVFPLYWAVGGLFLIMQTWVARKLYREE
ncbi:membrane protein insertase YidC [Sporosarcina sp. Te-1]|uniref:membrane protein insertase YidC n=1 Tax=Sporosarcina sp. Te-1 TaxID=2818390 RepID=UPI001A9E35C6|nr:membrane protein insertase YidC [Sporosarcina sp. Te-1]QTD43122.1 membrane protein insertase YidC [Sporosarcina sp. Te-1]